MIIGIDFDNTIVCYDEVFHRCAVEKGFISSLTPASKGSVRDIMRNQGMEEQWIWLQGYVYGERMREAQPFPAIKDFLALCLKNGVAAHIVSHKTKHPFRGEQYDLHGAAQDWLQHHGFYDVDRTGLSKDKVFFELTKQEKLSAIGRIGCTHFIDDLPEFLAEDSFPKGVDQFLFDPNDLYRDENKFRRVNSWQEIQKIIFQEAALP